MSNYSLMKCIAALAVLSLYVWLFGITGVVEGASAPFADESADFNPTLSELRSTTEPAAKAVTDAPVTYYETSINAENYKKPDFADYPAQTTAPFYYGEPESETETENTSAVTIPEETTSPQTFATTTAPEVTTAIPVTTAETTTSTLAEENDDLTEYEAEEEPETTSGTSTDSDIISVSVSGGKTVEGEALNIISRIVQNEVGSSFNKEAIKAQAVAAYTYVKYYNNSGLPARNVNLANDASERVKECVKEVLGQMVYYNGEIIQALYCGSSAGYTASAKNVYGSDYPYLQSKECTLDMRYDPNYGLAKSFTSNDIMTRVVSKTGIELTGDPSGWIKVLSHVDHVYVGEMTLGGNSAFKKNGEEVKITGRIFRETIMDYDIRSTAFDVSYDKSSDKFTFITYGYGHGVGMSQNGANALAQYEGYDYKQILQFYYTGTEVY